MVLHWAKQTGVTAIAIEDLDFGAEKTREKHGRSKWFRQLISGIPTGKLKARLVSMAAEQGLAVIAVDPAYTSMWGGQHWQKPLTTPHARCPVTMPPVSRSGDAPSDTRSGVGRHRPHTTGAIVWGIGPPRPHQVHESVREPAPASPDHGHDPSHRTRRERGRPGHPKPVGMSAATRHGSRTHSCSLNRNGSAISGRL